MKEVTRVLGATDVKYGIICAGAKLEIEPNTPVSLEYRGKIYHGKMHSKTKGRIDGLSQMYSDFNLTEGMVLKLLYNNDTIYASDSITDMTNDSNNDRSSNVDMDDPLFQTVMKKVPFEEFNGEYYGLQHKRLVTSAGNKLYYLYNSTIEYCEINSYNQQSKKLADIRGTYDGIYADDQGLYIYKLDIKSGIICRGYSFDGKEKFKVKIDSGTLNKTINAVYIKDGKLYGLTDTQVLIASLRTGLLENVINLLNFPQKATADNIVVCNGYFLIRFTNTDYEHYEKRSWWYKYQNGKVAPLYPKYFQEHTDVSMIFYHPNQIYNGQTQDIAWLLSNKRNSDKYWFELVGISLKSNKAFVKYCIKGAELDPKYIIYFDGKFLFEIPSNASFATIKLIDSRTGQFCTTETDQSLFLTEKLYVSGDIFYITVDYPQRTCKISMSDIDNRVDICGRLF